MTYTPIAIWYLSGFLPCLAFVLWKNLQFRREYPNLCHSIHRLSVGDLLFCLAMSLCGPFTLAALSLMGVVSLVMRAIDLTGSGIGSKRIW